jgi:hypothetical protein
VRDIVGNALGGLSYGRFLANVASVFIVGIGIIAALNQIGVATTVTTPILIAVLATIAGILIVGVGGGLVRPMQQRWEGWLDRAAQESRAVVEHAKAYQAGQADVRQSMTEQAPQPTRSTAEHQTGHEPAYAQGPSARPAFPASADEPTQVLPPTSGQPRTGQ